jgi:hypothetical protein
MAMMSTRLVCVLLLVAGCYDVPPPRVPQPDVPAFVPGATIDVETRSVEEMRRVRSHDEVCSGGSCSDISTSHTEPVTVKHATATYGGNKVTFGQAEALADPTYVADWQHMEQLSANCRHAAIPKYAGEVLTTVGLLLFVDGTATSDGSIQPLPTALGAVGLAAGIASYALGKYVFGGQDCAEATAIYGKHSWDAAGTVDVEDELADELQSVVVNFNQKVGHAPTASGDQTTGGTP